MDFKDIKKSVRLLLQDGQYDSDTILQAANWFIYELANNNKLRIFEGSAELQANAGDTTVSFPDDSMAWTGIYVTVPQGYDISTYYTDYGDFMSKHSGFAATPRANLRDWTMFGDGARFSAPLLSDTTFQFDYVREPTPMEDDSSTCDIPRRYIELVARGTKLRIMEIEEDYDYAQQEREILEPLVTTLIRNEARGGGKTKPTIISAGRRRRRED